MTVLGIEFFFGCGYEVVVLVVGTKVDGAAAEASAHNPLAYHSALPGYVVEEIELFARHFIVLGQTAVSLVH